MSFPAWFEEKTINNGTNVTSAAGVEGCRTWSPASGFWPTNMLHSGSLSASLLTFLDHRGFAYKPKG